MSSRSAVPPFVIAAAAVLLLVGCASGAGRTGSGTASATASRSPTPTASATPPSTAIPTVNPTDAINATTVIPSDFPPSVPLIEGDILTASSTSTGWVVWIKSSDPISGYSDASSALQDAGFTATADQSINGSAAGLFTNDHYTVTVTAGSDAKHPNAVGYQVDKK